ncbi:GNAT family N-acetyltransferase [Streptomyces sp. NPDC085481]|uniref:GNAT family N-acetyltransferase n=1 Tax=Streptomyces sp. NPDC085481 TaxID=3365727 RepID=UPI0037D43B2D
MSWHFTEDPEAFRAAVRNHLAAAPARHTALLTQLDVPGLRGWWAEPGEVRATGAFLVSPPGVPLLGVMPDSAARELARALPGVLSGAAEVTGVRGESGTVEAFAAAFGQAQGRSWRTTRRMRLYRLGDLTPPDPAPPGRPRLAVRADLPLAVGWMREFARDVGEDPDADYTANVAARVADGRLHLWEADDRPVAMASVSRTVAGQARVSPVYTPPAHRARGYGGAVTCAVSRAAVEAGAEQVLLFTDLANRTSNSLYQHMGYRPVTDHAAVEFGMQV